MRAYVETDRQDWAMRRVVSALAEYAPSGVEIVDKQSKADFVVLHVIGRRDRMLRMMAYISRCQQHYAVIQYALRSTKAPDTSDWLPIWRNAKLVWSYYDLKAWCAEDRTPFDFNFYHAPLGVDTRTFGIREPASARNYIIGTSGRSAVTESVREAVHATKRVKGMMFHLGPELRKGDDIVCLQDIDDSELAFLLNQCVFVAGLRRTEGFELMAAEGVLCGARPILFDRTHYYQWHRQWGIFIPEGSRPEVIDSLERIFRQGTIPITEGERQAAAELFNWETIMEGFWDGCLF